MQEIEYQIEYKKEALKNLEKLSSPIQEIILRTIERKLVNNPVVFGKPLKHDLKGSRSLRVGDYRVIYQIIEDKVLVLIIDIDHRKAAYNK